MNEKIYNQQNMIAYLLGSLPNDETERFDELSFTDHKFADELKAAEKDLVDAYVNGDLTGANLKQFKLYYLASPLRREQVEFAQAFQVFAEKELANETTMGEPSDQKAGFFSSLFMIPRLSLQWGFSLATLLLMLFGGWLFWENSRLRSEIGQTQSSREELLKRELELQQREKQLQDEIANQRITNAETEKELAKIREERQRLEQELKNSQEQKRIADQQHLNEQRAEAQKTPVSPNRQISIASFILAPSLRGNSQFPTISLPPETDLVAMQLQLETDDYKSYRVALQNPANGQTLWRSRPLKSKGKGANRVLNLRFPAKLLKSQVYSLQVSGVSASGGTEIISDYPFKVVP